MKQFLIFLLACSISFSSFAQQQNNGDNNNYGELKGGFKQENIFFGGSLSLGFYDRTFSIGANPQVGYSFAQWLDAGVAFNINYTTQRYTQTDNAGNFYNTKDALTSYGLGPFVKLYPVNFLFVQGQLEYNWTKLTRKYDDAAGVPKKEKYKVGAPSFIAGVGYTQRVVGQSSYFVMVGVDLIKDDNSPYVSYDPYSGTYYAQPIFRTGFTFYLKPSRQAERESRSQSARIL